MTQWGLDTIFNPGKRHMDEEKRRLQSTREEIGDSSGGRRIDLESGKVTIRRARPAEPSGDESADESADEAAAHEAVAHETAPEGEASPDAASPSASAR